MNPFQNRKPVIDPALFIGRGDAIRAVSERLMASPPQCCALVGDARSGKTSLLYYLRSSDLAPAGSHVTYAYVNVGPYAALGASQAHGALYFWRDLARAVTQALPASGGMPLFEPIVAETALVDAVYDLKCGVEELIRRYSDRTFVFLIDNIEGVARLPRHTSSFLRSLTQDLAIGARVAYIVTSRVPLAELYDAAELHEPSSFWSLFAGEIHVGGLRDDEIGALLDRAPELSVADRAWIRRLAGANLMLLLTAAAHVYQARVVEGVMLNPARRALLEATIAAEVGALCRLWRDDLGVAHPAGMAALRAAPEMQPATLVDEMLLEALRHRGLATHDGSGWRLAATLFSQVLAEPVAATGAAAATSEVPAVEMTPPAFTHLEGEVYTFLRERAGRVCTRQEVKRAIWPADPPSDSALQKIIERIREKIEPDPNNPRKLIAVRGQGYILRNDD